MALRRYRLIRVPGQAALPLVRIPGEGIFFGWLVIEVVCQIQSCAF